MGGRSSNRFTAKAIVFIVCWTVELHTIFLDAIRFLGDNEVVVVPSKVLEVMMNDERSSDILKAMNVQELTREHVASHLQQDESMVCSTSSPSSALSFGDNNVVVVAAAGNNDTQTMAASFGHTVAATPTIYPPIYTNNVGLGQHLTSDFIYTNQASRNSNPEESGVLCLQCFATISRVWWSRGPALACPGDQRLLELPTLQVKGNVQVGQFTTGTVI
nr:two-component response regulator ARR14-like [Ipomoea batatas]